MIRDSKFTPTVNRDRNVPLRLITHLNMEDTDQKSILANSSGEVVAKSVVVELSPMLKAARASAERNRELLLALAR